MHDPDETAHVLAAVRAPEAPAAPPAVDPRSDADALAARALTIARRTALGVLGDREAAHDVAQEVAVTALAKAGDVRDPAALDAWLHRTAVRAALKEARRGARRREAELAHHHQRERGGFTSAPDEAEHALRLLDGLPARQRAVMTLRYVHDLPDAAIAAALGCRTGTVRSLLSRGRDALRHHVDPTRGA